MTKRSKIITFLLLISIIIIQSCNWNNSNKVSAPADRMYLIDSLLNTAVKNNEIPGAVAYINRSGNIILHKAYGFRKLENRVPMQKDDIFRMASMTKALTAVAVLQLYERGLLLLDDKASKYVPDFENSKVLIDVYPDSSYSSKPASREITIRQLLTHTSGLGYGFQDERYNSIVIKNNISEGFEDDDRTSLENIKRIAKLPLLHEPGEVYTYSVSYDVLGVIIEIISGMRYDEYIRQYILDPLEMNNSYFIIPEMEQHRLVTAYQAAPSGNGFELTTYPDTAYPRILTRQYFSGGADLCSTAGDYGKFIQMILNNGVHNNTRILGKRFIEMMLSKQTTLEDGDSFQGFATWVVNSKGAAKGPMTAGSYGFGGFWDTYGWADPEKDFVAVLLLQLYPGNKHSIHEKFQAITYGVIDD